MRQIVTPFISILPHLLKLVKFDQPFKSLLEGIEAWTFSNRYAGTNRRLGADGVIYSQHRMIRNTNSQSRQSPRPVDEKLFSILPTTTALLIANNDANLTELWGQVKANLALKYEGNGIDLSHGLEARATLALFPPPTGVPALVPSVLLIFPIQDRANLEAALTKLKRIRISFNGKPIRFPSPIKYQGVELQPIQLQLGLIFALKGGYVLLIITGLLVQRSAG